MMNQDLTNCGALNTRLLHHIARGLHTFGRSGTIRLDATYIRAVSREI
jgi:hypothetical protein